MKKTRKQKRFESKHLLMGINQPHVFRNRHGERHSPWTKPKRFKMDRYVKVINQITRDMREPLFSNPYSISSNGVHYCGRTHKFSITSSWN